MDCSLPASSIMEFSKQEYWSGLPFPFPGDLPDPGIKPGSPVLQVDSLPSEPPGKPNVHPDSAATCNPHESKEKVKTRPRVQFFATLWAVPARLFHPWDSPGKNSGVSCHSLLQGIFPTQGSNLGLLHCRQILYRLSYHGSPGETINPCEPFRLKHSSSK